MGVLFDEAKLRGLMSPWFLGDLDNFLVSTNRMCSDHASNHYPPHNVYKQNDHSLILQMALAGIDPDGLELISSGNTFTISYTPYKEKEELEHQYKSISTRKFSKSFKLEDSWEVSSAKLTNGLLEVVISRKESDNKRVKIEVS